MTQWSVDPGSERIELLFRGVARTPARPHVIRFTLRSAPNKHLYNTAQRSSPVLSPRWLRVCPANPQRSLFILLPTDLYNTQGC